MALSYAMPPPAWMYESGSGASTKPFIVCGPQGIGGQHGSGEKLESSVWLKRRMVKYWEPLTRRAREPVQGPQGQEISRWIPKRWAIEEMRQNSDQMRVTTEVDVLRVVGRLAESASVSL